MKPTPVLAMLCGSALILFACTSPEDTPETTSSDTKSDPAAALSATLPQDRVVLFGDLHSHTDLSFDSYVAWNSNTQDDAYRFAKKDPTLAGLTLAEGHEDENGALDEGFQPALTAALDFAGITDHAEWFGELNACLDPTTQDVYLKDFCKLTQEKEMAAFLELIEFASLPVPEHHPICTVAGADCPGRSHSAWTNIQATAQAHNAPGTFTTLIAYEYTGLVANEGMQHRNVFFRNENVLVDPVDAIDFPHAEDLWRELEEQCNNQKNTISNSLPDCEVLAIAHNPNYSWGQMLDPEKNSFGNDHLLADLERRARMEPLIEIIQTKGGSECYTGLGTNDELCNFEHVFPRCTKQAGAGGEHHCVDERAFVRNAFKEGLVLDQTDGVNPFKFGIIASTDSHNGITGATEEDQYKGHHGESDVTAEKRIEGGVPGLTENPKNNPGGLAAVVADSNTRDGIFDALKRKETFGTSGTRITVRFFGGFDYLPNFFEMGMDSQTLLGMAYDLGVPMGADLPVSSATPPDPSFLVWAMSDPNGAPLQKVQIIKGWNVGTDTYEEVIDVICADGTTPTRGAKCSKIGTANLADCSYSPAQSDGDRGAAELKVQWTDTEFDATRRAFYYVRVLENPTCRWSTYDAIELGTAPPTEVPSTIQERAWSSPIWYTPGS